jgi:hypothetical protein
MSADLITFLRARLDEDEALALAASPGPWHPDAESYEVLAADDITVCDGFALSGPQLRATTEHIARWDPARVLAEVAAKRAVVDGLAAADPHAGYITGTFTARHALWLLAQSYADHPDYREEWKP